MKGPKIEFYFCEDFNPHIGGTTFAITPKEYFDEKGFLLDSGSFDPKIPDFQRVADEYKGYIIHGFPRAGTGTHGNNYVKIKKGGIRGKFLLDTENWEPRYDLDDSTKKELTKYILNNKADLREKIKNLG